MDPSHSKRQTTIALNPRTTSYEFFGPLGALLITISTPCVVYSLFFICNDYSEGCHLPTPESFKHFNSLSDTSWWKSLWDTSATLIYFEWYLFCVVAWEALPGKWIQGLTMRNGEKKEYKINGFSTFLVAIGLALSYIYTYGPEGFTFFYKKWVGFITASLLMSIIQSVYCYLSSFYGEKLLTLGGNTGNIIYDVRPE